jgi:dihydroorotate dehydrogenase electron transfer subunit
MQDSNAEIVGNKALLGPYWSIRLHTGWKEYQPGQFVMVKAPKAFLRRPFSILDLQDGVVEICYKVIGKGTSGLSLLKAGERLQVLGPLGKGFEIRKADRHIMVAGGYGFAPFFGLSKRLREDCSLFYGAKNITHLIYMEEFKKMGVNLYLSTEDGSIGRKGIVTDDFKKMLPVNGSIAVYGCGPKKMLDAVKKICGHAAGKLKISCQLSLESYMACGIGVCHGCVTKNSKGEYVRVCKEGPVFDSRELI